MKHFYRLWLFLLLGGWLASSPAMAGLCANVFPARETPTGSSVGAVLDLSIMDTETYTAFPSDGKAYPGAGDFFYRDLGKGKGSKLDTKKTISVTPGMPVRIFVDGDLDLGSDSKINPNGYAGDLILIVRGNLNVGTKNQINALIYVTGNIGSNPQTRINGALTAQGAIDTGKQDVVVTYDSEAAKNFAFADLCDPTSPPLVHHYQLSYASQALTCQAHEVVITACANADCSSTLAASGSLRATDSTGASVASVVFAIGSSGTSVALLPVRTPGMMTLGVDEAVSQCNVAGCALDVADSGFILDVPPLLAGQQASASIRAVRADENSELCVPAFESGTRTLLFTSDYASPTSGTLAPQVNGQEVGVATPVDVTFQPGARAPLLVRYDDAGQMSLEALYAPASGPELGLVMRGSTTYVARPYGLHLVSDASCTSADLAGCATVLRAGADSFALRIRAVAWTVDGEPLTAAALADNPTTPNFQLADISLSSTVVAPDGGADGSLSPDSYSHQLGESTQASLTQSEVGIFRVTATPPSGGYFGQTVNGGESGLIGRFIPDYLQADASAQLAPACGTFSYQQQEIGFAPAQAPLLTVTGYNRQGEVTKNYDRGEFWRLAAPQRQDYLSITGRASVDVEGRLEALGSVQASPLTDLQGDGSRQFRWEDNRLRWKMAGQPTAEDLPFGKDGATIARLTLPAEELTDADNVCYRGASGREASCQDFSHDFGGSEVRLGRLRFGNAFGSELQGLDVPFWLETWRELSPGVGGFRTEVEDSCSTVWLGEALVQSIGGAIESTDLSAATVQAPIAGQGAVRLPAPGKEGSVQIGLSGLEIEDPATGVAAPWLLHGWGGATTPQAARGLATFGIYKGSAPLIFRRELYR